MEPLRVGLIGHGEIVESKLAPALARISSAKLWSVLGRDRSRAAEFAKRHGIASAYDDLGAMLADPALDAVIVATPDRMHAGQAIAAGRAGKHAFVEKPMATTVEEAKEILAACGRVRLAVGYHHRWHRGHLALSEAIRSGELGEPVHFQGAWFYPMENGWRNRPETGRWWSLAAVGTHLIDLAWWFLGGEVTKMSVLISTAKTGGPHDESAVFSMEFASGATATVATSAVRPSFREFQIVGTKAQVTCRWTLGGRGAGTIAFQDGRAVAFEPSDPYEGELRDFVAAIREGRDPRVSGEVGLRNVEFLCGGHPDVESPVKRASLGGT